ncbi:ATPase [archaeon]|nr:ATPase [archaeon]
MYYTQPIKRVLKLLNTTEDGLNTKEVTTLLKKLGQNKLPEKKKSNLKLFLSQFANFIIYILFFALLISIAIPIVEHGSDVKVADFSDAFVIISILLLNAALGYFQEKKAERAIALLRRFSAQNATVIRDGKKQVIDSSSLVPGDIVVLDTGAKIPADGRIIDSVHLEVNESSFTGESNAVKKQTKELKSSTPLAERTNMVYSGTTVVAGRGTFVVTATGKQTEIGKLATMVQTTHSPQTPLQKRLARLGRIIGISVLAVSLIIFIIGITQMVPWIEMLLFATSLAVAAVPEGLPAVVTITLAIGVSQLLKRKTLVKRLRSVETLGSVNVICTDKTGTVTENKMHVTDLYIDNSIIPTKKFKRKNAMELLNVLASCNNATLPDIGSPTELALFSFADKHHVKRQSRIDEIPFSSSRKYMQTTHEQNGKKYSYLKGAPEVLIPKCTSILINSKRKKLTTAYKKKLLKANNSMANKALRVIACVRKTGSDQVFLGLVGMQDPPRRGVKEAINLCKQAGIKTYMITGDNAATASAIASKIGLSKTVLEGQAIDSQDEKQLIQTLESVSVFARVSPQHKVKILNALQKSGKVVAMTGDGVNDAPAIKNADIGIAMGQQGTDLCKDSADFVLTDDHFSTIVSAIYQGRVIFDNIKKFIVFLLATNFGEVLIVIFSLLLLTDQGRLLLPLLPIHLLWINLVTDGLPALALSVEKGEGKVMKRGPNNPKDSILKGSLFFILAAGVLVAFSVLWLFSLYQPTSIELARTVALTTIILFELFLVFSCRSKESLFKVGIFSNKWLVLAVGVALGLHLTVLYTPLSAIFHLVPLSLNDWVRIVPFALVGLVFFEVKKILSSKL